MCSNGTHPFQLRYLHSPHIFSTFVSFYRSMAESGSYHPLVSVMLEIEGLYPSNTVGTTDSVFPPCRYDRNGACLPSGQVEDSRPRSPNYANRARRASCRDRRNRTDRSRTLVSVSALAWLRTARADARRLKKQGTKTVVPPLWTSVCLTQSGISVPQRYGCLPNPLL